MKKRIQNVNLLREYSNYIDCWTYAKRYKNKHKVDILKYDLIEELLKIIKDGYELKELFLDSINYSDYEQEEKEIKKWILVVKKL